MSRLRRVRVLARQHKPSSGADKNDRSLAYNRWTLGEARPEAQQSINVFLLSPASEIQSGQSVAGRGSC
ncbi:hypothetical protein [Tatumella sp. JGM118]|uniref:Uncharacterized protein n=1 Tax=Tatumella terrea TaxID=419007 RepID=A0ABW1VX59_9GAMM|nr:hypothetical protein [Tatumella sp. JGM118]MBS0910305.1 hypothetical protein [Tatumella sp. JGM118]